MNTGFKIFALVFAVLFIWAAGVQWNDPDSLIWVIIYLIPASMSVLFVFNKLSVPLTLVIAFLYLIGTALIWPDMFEGFTIGEGDIVNIERGREAFGLLMVALVLFIYALMTRLQRRL